MPRPALRSATCIAVLALLAGAVLPAQEAPPDRTFGEALQVELVEVEVLVTDRSGDPVLDLRPGDFRVTDDGRPVEIRQFQPPPAAGDASADLPAGPSASPAPGVLPAPDELPRQGLRLVLFVDRVHLGPAGQRRLVEQLREVLRGGLGEDDRVMVATYDGSLEVALPFTSDRRAVLAAIDGLERLSAHQLMAGRATEQAMEVAYEQLRSDNTEGGRRDGIGIGAAGDACSRVGNLAQFHAEQIRSEVEGTIAALTRFVDSLAGVPGRKVLLHVSDGLPLVPGGEVWSYVIEMCDGTALRAGIPYAFDVTSVGGLGRFTRFDPVQARVDMEKNDTSTLWQRLAAHASSQQVTVYPVQASGLGFEDAARVSGVRTTMEAARFRRHNLQDGLVLLAGETGGQALINANDFTPELERVLDHGENRYLLAYAPPTPGDGRRHAIGVEVDRPGVRVKHRRSYHAKSFEERVVDGVFASLIHGWEENPLGVRVEVASRSTVEREEGAEATRLRLRIRVPLERLTLLPGPGGRQGIFSVFLVGRDVAGGTTDLRTRSIPLQVPAARLADALATDYLYEVEMTLEREPRDLGVAVKDELGGAVSTLREPLTDAG